MLSLLNKTSTEDIQLAGRIFDKYDLNQNGDLTLDVIDKHLKAAKENELRLQKEKEKEAFV